jgi:hypothetical protein
MRSACLLTLAMLGVVGCGASKAEIARAEALREAQRAAANERAAVAFLASWHAQRRPTLQGAPLTSPAGVNPIPPQTAVAGAVVGAAIGAAILGEAFSNSQNNVWR